jgi:putative tricarboxylic transport membrane protein
MARALFSGAFLAFALAYTLLAFGLPMMVESNQIGPGFFPRILGATLIAASLYALVRDFREPADDDASSDYWRMVALVTAIMVAFVAMLSVLGALVAMVLFMFVTLYVLNREGMITNVLLSILLPVSLYLMFDVWLNTTLPRGILFALFFG